MVVSFTEKKIINDFIYFKSFKRYKLNIKNADELKRLTVVTNVVVIILLLASGVFLVLAA